ncbi:RNA polymerase sigma factor [Streptomyces fildesensis]|uniref:RNA polymerase sigma factor n=1 Tax=Streptomyces fildesensis TaxID=375757 RepID=A0ABW8CC05_9ACTN
MSDSGVLRELTEDELLDCLEQEPRPPLQARTEVYSEIARRHGPAVLRYISRQVDDYHEIQDVVQEAFTDAFAYLEKHTSIRAPRRLGPWLTGVAKNRVHAHWRGRTSRPGLQDGTVQELKERESEVREGDDPVLAAQVRRLLPEVCATLDPEGQELYRLRIEEGLTSKVIATRLRQSPKTVGNKCTELAKTVAQRYHILLLVRGDRTVCADLRDILEAHEAEHGRAFTQDLAKTVMDHYSTCPTCGDCAVCRYELQQLVRDNAPALVPVLLAAALRERIERALQDVADSAPIPQGLRQPPPGPPPPPAGPPAASKRPRPPKKLRRRIIQAGAAVAVVLTVIAVKTWLPGTHAQPVAVRAQDQAATSITTAMTGKRLVAFDVDARNVSDPAWFLGQARLDMVPNGTVAAATHVLYDYGEGHSWYPPNVVLIGDRAYVTPENPVSSPAPYGPTTIVDGASGHTADLNVSNALQTRWLGSPANIAEILKDAAPCKETDRTGTRTFTGSAPLRTLADNPAAAFFYRPYIRPGIDTAVSFTIVTDQHYLPTTLTIRIPFPHTGVEYLAQFPDDPFTVTYRDWAKGRPITAPAAPPSPQWGGLPQ